MKLCSMIINEIKSVYQYEKKSRVDIGTLQNVMMIFVVVMLLIDIQNLKLGEYVIAAITFVVAVVSIFAILALGHSDKIYRICMAAVIAFLILAVPISLWIKQRIFNDVVFSCTYNIYYSSWNAFWNTGKCRFWIICYSNVLYTIKRAAYI